MAIDSATFPRNKTASDGETPVTAHRAGFSLRAAGGYNPKMPITNSQHLNGRLLQTGSSETAAGLYIMPFAPLLTETLERRTAKVLELLAPASQPSSPLPFPMSPAFREIYGQLLRVGVIPLILNRRQTQVLEKQCDWENDGTKQLLETIKAKSNPIFDGWDAAWSGLWDTYDPNHAKASQADPKGRNGNGKSAESGSGGLLQSVTGLFRKEKSGKDKRSTANGKAKPSGGGAGTGPKPCMAGIQQMVGEHARHNGYLPPRPDDIELLKDLIRVNPKSLEDAWHELSQLHIQEFRPTNPKERARSGSLSEAMTKWQYSLPQRLGEMLAVKAAADLEFCDAEFVKQYIRHSARSQEEGEQSLPYLTLYQRSMPKVIR